MWHFSFRNGLLHRFIWISLPAVNTALSSETPMSFNNHLAGHTRLALKTVNVLRKQLQQTALVIEQLDERMSNRRPKPTRIKLAGQCIKWLRVLPEEANVEDSLGVWQFQMCQVGVDTGVWGTEIRNPSRGTDSGSYLIFRVSLLHFVP